MHIFTLIGAEEVVVQLYIFCYSFKVLLIVRYRFLLVVLVNLKVSQIISQYNLLHSQLKNMTSYLKQSKNPYKKGFFYTYNTLCKIVVYIKIRVTLPTIRPKVASKVFAVPGLKSALIKYGQKHTIGKMAINTHT